MSFFTLIFAFLLFSWVFLVYTWIGYPLILLFLTRKKTSHNLLFRLYKKFINLGGASQLEDKPYSRGRGKDVDISSKFSYLPSVSILLSAYNEERHIEDRIQNLTELDYPNKKIKIFIGIDCSTDRTTAIAQDLVPKIQGLEVYVFKKRRGKIAVLKDLVAKSKSDILFFTDANTVFESNVLNKLIPHFQNPSVGGVCGRLLFIGEKEENFYWKMENHLKKMESRLDSCLGANGAIYAIRRNLFCSDIPNNTIVDDFVIGMKVREQKKLVLFETDAIAKEDLPPTNAERSRRIRIGAGDYQALMLCRKCLLPQYKKFAWMFWSHKVFRWFTPQIMLGLLLCNAYIIVNCLISEYPDSYSITLVTISSTFFLIFFFLSALAGHFLRNFPFSTRKIHNILRLCTHFLTMQLALFLGFIHFCKGNLQGHWKRTSRD